MKILFENKDLIIVYKESGKPVQNDSSNEKSLIDEVSDYINSNAYVITRLDRPVRGVCLFAKNKQSAAKLSSLLQEHKIQKTYYAIVCGNIKEKGSLENYIFKNQRQNMSKIVNKGNIGAKLAQLEYTPIKTIDNMTLVKINLITGRHHQIRVQFSHIGCPLYGDTKYNPQFKHKRNVTTALFAAGLNIDNKINVEIKPDDALFQKFMEE